MLKVDQAVHIKVKLFTQAANFYTHTRVLNTVKSTCTCNEDKKFQPLQVCPMAKLSSYVILYKGKLEPEIS